MVRAWKIVIGISFAAILLGAVCIGVGILTGADFERIFTILNDRYQLIGWYEWALESIERNKHLF